MAKLMGWKADVPLANYLKPIVKNRRNTIAKWTLAPAIATGLVGAFIEKKAQTNTESGAAGMAAHLAGALKSNSTLPVIGVPLPGGILDGLDSLMATLQMPKGLPVATVTVGKHGFINAAILSAEILSLNDDTMHSKLDSFKGNGCKI